MQTQQTPPTTPPQPTDLPVGLAELTQGDWAQWRHHPVTAVFLRFLVDRREALAREMVQRWLAGRLVLSDEKEGRGRALELEELAMMPLAGVRTFYGLDAAAGAPEVRA